MSLYWLRNKIIKNKYFLLLTVFVVILVLLNIRKDTTLTGWDSTQTDLFPTLGIKRAVWSVWHEYQSFGLVGGMAYASDLVRSIFIWLISFIMPLNYLRYFFHGLMVLSGALGIYKLLCELIDKENNEALSFIGSLFYVLNLFTIQIMSLPFEPFSTFFGMLPWEIWIFLKIINSKSKLNKKDLLYFFVINILATPQSFTQQIFLVYLITLVLITVGQVITVKSSRIIIKSGILILYILLINSFWILPQMYFLKTNGWWIKEAKINQLATKETFLQNVNKGDIFDLLTFNNFYYDFKTKNSVEIFNQWKIHFNNSMVGLLPLFFGILILIGLIKGRNKYKFSFLVVFLFCTVALLSNTPPFSWISEIFRLNPLINQIFRSPFTKFSSLYALISTYFFILSIALIISLFKENIFFRQIKMMLITIFSILIVVYAFPALSGNYFSQEMKVNIPQEYTQLFDYFNKIDKNKRIALLPDFTFWGWFYYRWGYNGSGFIWYGIEQPIISRTFDVWSPYSESYYWEIKTAIEAEDKNKFALVLDKYNIDYLLLDKTLMPINTNNKALGYDRLNTLLDSSKQISLVYYNKNINLYKINKKTTDSNFIKVINQLPTIGPQVTVTNDDRAFSDFNNYITNDYPDYYYPFMNLTTLTDINNKNWNITEDYSYFYLESKTNLDLNQYTVESSLENYEIVDNNTIVFKIKKELLEEANLGAVEVINCGNQAGTVTSENNSGFLSLYSSGSAIACFGFDYRDLSQREAYLVSSNSENIKGSSLFFYILDDTKKQTYFEGRLNNGLIYHIIAPRFKYGIGYAFKFQNSSLQNLESVNHLNFLKIYKFPYDQLKNIKLIKKQIDLTNTYSTPIIRDSKKINYYKYSVNLTNEKGTLILYQSFSPGWRAYQVNNGFPFALGHELRHVLINDWANGWVLDGANPQQNINAEIIIIFWPQYLEFLGFGLLILAFLFIFRSFPLIK